MKMKNASQFFIWMFVCVVFTLVSCAGDGVQTQPENPEISQTTELETTEPTAAEPTAVEPTAEEHLFAPETGKYPVAVSYIEKADQGVQIISKALNYEADYSTIFIDKKVEFRNQATVDGDGNLYLIYGSKDNRMSKLGVNGEVETIDLPYEGQFQSIWAGDKFFILSTENSMAIVDTSLEVTIHSPAINIVDDEIVLGNLGITTTNDVIWVASLPLETESGDYALYRMVSMENYEITKDRLPIPDSNWDWAQEDPINRDPNDRLGTIIHAVYPDNARVLLCYYHRKEEEESIYSTLELYDTQDNTSTISLERCCMNNEIEHRGDTIIENSYPESCGYSQVLNSYDLKPSFSTAPYRSIKNLLNNWVGSNGRYWLIHSDQEITVINEDREFEATYPLPSDLPQDWIRASTLVPAFLIDE